LPVPILARLLTGLGDLLKLDGSRVSPSEYAIESPAQPVHDLARWLEWTGAKINETSPGRGYFEIQIPTTHAAGDTQVGVADPYALLAAIAQIEIARLEIWLIQCWPTASDGDLTSCGLSLTFPATMATGGGAITHGFPLAFYTGTDRQYSEDGVAATYFSFDRTGSAWGGGAPTPMFIPRGTLFTTVTVSSAAITTTRSHFLCWAGPVGTRPPGVA